jgi:4-hydroxy-tetrahydrodipicolinate synthase
MGRFFADVGRAAGVPIILQNAPSPMGIGLSIDAIAKLLEEAPAIAFVKEETPPCGQRITALLGQAGSRLRGVFGGAGGRYVIDEMNRGAAGTMPASELIEIHVAMLAAHRGGQLDRARDLFERCLPLLSMQAIFRWRLTKEVLLRRGLIESTYTRAPGPVLDTFDLKELDALLARLADLTGGLG